jgi:hypothetical protein
MDVLLLAKALVCAFFAVLFLQSGVDKIVDRKGNLDWMTPHFESSPFKGLVPMLLSVLTLMELATGLACAAGVVVALIQGPALVPQAAMTAVCATLIALFTGQRLAKDYAGAVSIASYFAAALLGLALTGFSRLP